MLLPEYRAFCARVALESMEAIRCPRIYASDSLRCAIRWLGSLRSAARVSLNFRRRRISILVRRRLLRGACLQKQAPKPRAMLISSRNYLASVLPDSRDRKTLRNANSTTEALPAEDTRLQRNE